MKNSLIFSFVFFLLKLYRFSPYVLWNIYLIRDLNFLKTCFMAFSALFDLVLRCSLHGKDAFSLIYRQIIAEEFLCIFWNSVVFLESESDPVYSTWIISGAAEDAETFLSKLSIVCSMLLSSRSKF